MSANQGNPLPERIDPDAILEALVEFRFEDTELPELIVGRLLDAQLWEGYIQTRLPTADIPQPIREMDINLRYQPSVELRRANRAAKIGSHVVSYHIVGSYPGWVTFRQEIEGVLREVISKRKAQQFSRIALRYINALRPAEHRMSGLADTNIRFQVGDQVLTESVAVTYNRPFAQHVVTVRVATPDLVIGNIQPGYSLLCDIDVGSKAGHIINNGDEAMAWIEEAHTLEKTEFFSILPESVTKTLTAKTGGNNDV